MTTQGTLDRLYDARGGRPIITYVFLGACVVVTVPSLVFPSLYDVFGGIAPRRYPWQLFTAVFEHGWPGFPGAIHLALNTFLIVEAGRPCERLLGSPRFGLLCLAAAGANAVAQLLTDGVNGSSLVIWAWGPPLFVALQSSGGSGMGRERITMVLVIMYVVVTLAMPLIPYLGGWRGNVFVAFGRANLYHLVATAVGIGGALFWRSHIRDGLENFERGS